MFLLFFSNFFCPLPNIVSAILRGGGGLYNSIGIDQPDSTSMGMGSGTKNIEKEGVKRRLNFLGVISPKL